MKQQVIITDLTEIINEMLKAGWEIESVTPQHVATSNKYASSQIRGHFCFVLKKKEV